MAPHVTIPLFSPLAVRVAGKRANLLFTVVESRYGSTAKLSIPSGNQILACSGTGISGIFCKNVKRSTDVDFRRPSSTVLDRQGTHICPIKTAMRNQPSLDSDIVTADSQISTSRNARSCDKLRYRWLWLLSRSLLKISFTRRVDHSKSRSFVVWIPLPPSAATEVGPLLHVLCARSFGIRIRLRRRS